MLLSSSLLKPPVAKSVRSGLTKTSLPLWSASPVANARKLGVVKPDARPCRMAIELSSLLMAEAPSSGKHLISISSGSAPAPARASSTGGTPAGSSGRHTSTPGGRTSGNHARVLEPALQVDASDPRAATGTEGGVAPGVVAVLAGRDVPVHRPRHELGVRADLDEVTGRDDVAWSRVWTMRWGSSVVLSWFRLKLVTGRSPGTPAPASWG